MRLMTCVTFILVFFGPAAAIFLARKFLPGFRRAGVTSLAVTAWLISIMPICQIVALVTLGVVIEASQGQPARGRDLTGVPYADIIQAAAAHHNLDPALIAAVIEQESAFKPDAISRAGAMGLMQIMPGTAADLGLMQPYSPAANIEAGTHYLAWLLDRYDGNLELALAAYNAGPGRVDRCHCIPQNGETPGYVVNVLAAAERYRGQQNSQAQEIILPYRGRYRLINNGLHGDGYWPGRDFAAACGSPLYAPISGRVERVGFDGYTGPHGSFNSFVFFSGETAQVMMMHGEYLVRGGQSVRQGELIGYEASFGNSSGCHTHLAVRVRGELVDPVSIFE